ncbi:MAG: CoF synthetase [Candidatus Pristimantibacillus sp.]
MRISMNDSQLRAKWEGMNRQYPWYADYHKGSGVPEWSELPLLTHERLLPYFEQDEGSNHSDWNVYRTSGTSSKKRKAIYYDAADEFHYVNQKTKLFAQLLQGIDAKRALSDMGTGHAEATAVQIFEQLGLECESVPFGLPAAAHLLRLTAFRPDVLYTMPSLLDGLIRVAPTGFDWGVKRVIVVGEPAPPAWRQRMAEQLDIGVEDIRDTYGSIEIGTIAHCEPVSGRYLLLEGLIAEGVSPDEVGLPEVKLPPDEQILVLTSLDRHRFPSLRYVTYDVVRDLRTDEIAGKPVTTFAAIVKRVGPELKHGEKISIYDIENVVFKHMQQAEVRVVVQGGKLQVNIAAATPVDQVVREAVRTELQGAIPEIGAMIRGGLLVKMDIHFTTIDASALGSNESADIKLVKHKKLYIHDELEAISGVDVEAGRAADSKGEGAD